MENNKGKQRDDQDTREKNSEREQLNPFKEKQIASTGETKEEEAEMEQQRKEALTERD